VIPPSLIALFSSIGWLFLTSSLWYSLLPTQADCANQTWLQPAVIDAFQELFQPFFGPLSFFPYQIKKYIIGLANIFITFKNLYLLSPFY
jgi:hypothetical protein